MKFECEKTETVLPYIQQAQNIVGHRTTLQILSNVLIEASEGKLHFCSTDLEMGIDASCAVDSISEGKTTVPARKFFDILRTLPNAPVSVEVDDNHTVHIRCGKCYYKVFGISPEDFPKLPDFSGSQTWEIPQSLLKKIIHHTSFAISRDESRYVLHGINFIFKKNSILGVATDGRRLSLSRHDGFDFADENVEFIVPAKAINELSKLLGDEGPVKISYSGNQVSFDMGSTRFISKLIEGNFPEYQKVIPSEPTQIATFVKKDFMETIQRASILTTEKSNSIKLSFEDGKCIISANTPQLGEVREELEVEFNGESPLQIAFNPGYIIDILKCLQGDKVNLELIDSLQPGIIRDKDEFLGVIMPMRLMD